METKTEIRIGSFVGGLRAVIQGAKDRVKQMEAEKVERETRRKAEEARRQEQNAGAVEFTRVVLMMIMEMMHYLVKGNPAEVAHVRQEAVVMQQYNEAIDGLRHHHLHGNGIVAKDGDEIVLRFGDEDLLHCAVVAKVTAMKLLADQMTRSREVEPGNGDRLPPLTPREIGELGLEIGALEEVGSDAKSLRVGNKNLAPAKNGNLVGKVLEDWQLVLRQLADHSRVTPKASLAQLKPAIVKSTMVDEIASRSVHSSIGTAMNKGGEFAIEVPDVKTTNQEGQIYTVSGGKVLLVFDRVGRTVSVANKGTEAVTTGHVSFVRRMSNLFGAGAEVTYNHVDALIDARGGLENPVPSTPRVNHAHMGLWYALRAYIAAKYGD